jgi:hypothetical protein
MARRRYVKNPFQLPIPKAGFTKTGVLYLFKEQGWVSNGHWCVWTKKTKYPLLFRDVEITQEVMGVRTECKADLKLDQMVSENALGYLVTRWVVREWNSKEAIMLKPDDGTGDVVYIDAVYAKHLGLETGAHVWFYRRVISDTNKPEDATFLLACINDDRQPELDLEESLALDHRVASV